MSALASTTFGADPDQLERAARDLRAAADELDSQASSLTSSLRSVAWVGGVATHFNADWRGAHRPRMASTAQAVREAAAALDRHADEQRAASAMVTDGPSVAGTWSQPSSQNTNVVDDLAVALEALGVGRNQLEVLSDLAGALAADGAAGRLIDMLTDGNFVQLLQQADHFISVGDFALNLVTDFVEHPHLSVDDRIVHALADASLRFGITAGAEKAAEFLAGAVTTALVPGLGAVFAPVVGKAAGMLVDQVVGEIVEHIDNGTDFVDDVSDLAVDIWQGVKDGFGVMIDVGGAVIDVVGDAADLVGDVGGALVDAGGTTVGVLGDAAGGAVDAVDAGLDWLGL